LDITFRFLHCKQVCFFTASSTILSRVITIIPTIQEYAQTPLLKDYGQTDENMVLIYDGIPSTAYWPHTNDVSTTHEVLVDTVPRVFAST
jgi:hypothetical protein